MAKKDKPLYDEQGRWVEERGRIKGAMRKTFRLSPQHKEAKQDARVELSPALKKDGTPGKKPRIRFKCAMCGELFPMKQGKSNLIQVDHVKPVVPLWKKESEMSYDELAKGVFCPKDNLQVLCSTPLKLSNGKSSCHKLKTDEENWIRKRLIELNYTGVGLSTAELLCFKQDYSLYLTEKEEKVNERKKQKNSKRRRNTSAD